jgi:hypothetical protein
MIALRSFILPISIVVLACCSANRQDGSAYVDTGEMTTEIRFEKTEHDLGRILQGETVGYTFKFTNVGESALMILEAQASCGCTVPRYSRKPIPPGESGVIEVVFDSSGRMGQQNKTVSIRTNALESTVQLTIKADIYQADT